MEKPETLSILSTLVPFALIIFMIAVGVVLLNQQFRKNLYKQQLERETLKIKHQESLLYTSLEVQEKERKRIAKDLHDELGAVLSIGKMQLLQLERSTELDLEKIRSVRELIESTLASTRRISHELIPLNLERLGLENALKSLLSEVSKTREINANIEMTQQDHPLPELIELGLYRICSEFINNTLKYAKASTIDISILISADFVYTRYADNGIGLDVNHSKEGLGFKSIQNRISTLQGTLKYGTSTEGGFYAEFKIPINR